MNPNDTNDNNPQDPLVTQPVLSDLGSDQSLTSAPLSTEPVAPAFAPPIPEMPSLIPPTPAPEPPLPIDPPAMQAPAWASAPTEVTPAPAPQSNFGLTPTPEVAPPVFTGGSPTEATPPPATEESSTPAFGEEAAPTDLSHLMGSGTPPLEVPLPAGEVQPETIIVPSSTEPNQVVTGGETKTMPKWLLIIGGLIMLLIVGGVSIYFILGVGRQSAPPVSLPAEQSVPTVPAQSGVLPAVPSPEVTTVENQTPGTFGQVQGLPTPVASSSGTSAMERARQLQLQGQ